MDLGTTFGMMVITHPMLCARVYGVDVRSRMNAIPKDYISKLKTKYRAENPLPSNTQYGWIARR